MALDILTLIFLTIATTAGLYYFIFSLLGMRRSRIISGTGTHRKILILIPAHNEESMLGKTLESLRKLEYPVECVQVIVVADNCSDGTENIARQAGVTCLVRNNPKLRGKGYALAYGLTRALELKPDLILILDADCTLSSQVLTEINSRYALGDRAIQVPVVSTGSNNRPIDYVAAVGTEIDNTVFAGWNRVGGSIPLRGTGMAFARDILERYPWSLHSLVEDAEYYASLRRAGIRVTTIPSGRVLTTAPRQSRELINQRRRWRIALGVPGNGWAASFIYSKPLVLIQLMMTCLLVLANPRDEFVFLALTVMMMTLFVYIRAMIKVGFRIPNPADFMVLLRLMYISVEGFFHRENQWHRTGRS